MFNGLSLKVKLLLLCGFMAAIIGAVSLVAYKGLSDITTTNDQIVNKVVPSLALINSMGLHYRQVRIELRSLGLTGISKQDADQAIAKTLESIAAYEKDDDAYKAIPFVAGEKELYDNMDTHWDHFKGIGERALNLYKSGKPEDREAMMKIFFVDCPESAAEYTKAFTEILNFNKNNFNKFAAESKSTASHSNMLIISISFIGIGLSIIVGFIFASKLSNSINVIVQSLKGSAEEVSNAASKIASSSEQLSQATTEQASSLQETSSSIEEINSMINANTESAKQSAVSSEKSLANAEKGKEVVGEMIRAIAQINTSNDSIMDQIDESNKEIEGIVKLISEIGNKTKVINDIVFQTKLLSFNASVEAARAGENGKGFAVVAEEVGKLASMSGAAALEISTLLASSINKVEAIVATSKQKVSKLVAEGKISVETGTRIANQCGEVLNEIVTSVATVSNAISEISTASQEQAQGVHEVTKAIAQLDQVTQENTANSADSANAAATLSQQAMTLTDLVSDLVKTVDGKNEDGVSHAPKAVTKPVQKSAKVLVMKSRPEPKVSRTVNSFPLADDARFSDV